MLCLQYSEITYRQRKCDIGNLSWWRSHDNSVSRWVILTVRIFIMLQWAILFIRRQLYKSSNKGTWYQIAKTFMDMIIETWKYIFSWIMMASSKDATLITLYNLFFWRLRLASCKWQMNTTTLHTRPVWIMSLQSFIICVIHPLSTPQSTVYCDQLYHLTRDYHFVIAWSLVLSVTPSLMSQSCIHASYFCFVLPLFQSIGMVTAIWLTPLNPVNTNCTLSFV